MSRKVMVWRAITATTSITRMGEIVISKLAHRNVNGLPYASTVNFTHSSDLRTMQEIFHAGPFLRDAANATDLSDLFKEGVIPSGQRDRD